MESMCAGERRDTCGELPSVLFCSRPCRTRNDNSSLTQLGAEVNYVAYGVSDVMTRMMLVPVSQDDITDGASEVDPVADPLIIKKAYPVSSSRRIHITRECVRSIFPEAAEGLDKMVVCKDVHDMTWNIRLTWWSGPALTDGWMKFVEYKSLKPGDHVVLMRYVGKEGVLRIRIRSGRIAKRDDHMVEGAAEPAAQGLPFVVEYYPCLGTPEFVVSASRVNAAIMCFNQGGELGLKPVVSYEDGDTLEIRKCVSVQDLVWGPYNSAHWLESPWRYLQVYVPELKWVSPWEVNRYRISNQKLNLGRKRSLREASRTAKKGSKTKLF